MIFSLVSAAAVLMASLVSADDNSVFNKAILNEYTTATLTVTPGQPVVTPTVAAPSYSVYQTTETTVVGGTTLLVTINPKIVNDITIWVTVTAEGSSSAVSSSSSSSSNANAVAASTSASSVAAEVSSSVSYSSTYWVTETEVDTVTVDGVFTIYT